MTLQQLRYVLAAAEHGSFGAAAEALHMSQPSLSDQVRRLEGELGVPLFTRGGRGVVLTEAGQTLRLHAERTLAEAEATREAVSAVRRLEGGLATFGMSGSSRWYAGTEIVAEFHRRHPKVRVRVVGQNSSTTADLVRAGHLECGIVALPVDDRGLDVRVVLHDEVFCASADPARVGRPMTMARLVEAPLVLSYASSGSEDPARRQLGERAQREGVRIEPVLDVEDVETAIELAARGYGDTILSGAMINGLRIPGSLRRVRFKEPMYDSFAFVSRRGAVLSPATRELVAIAEEQLEALARTLEL